MSSCPTEARTQTAAPDRWQEAFDALERRVTSHPLFPQLVHHVATDESHTFPAHNRIRKHGMQHIGEHHPDWFAHHVPRWVPPRPPLFDPRALRLAAKIAGDVITPQEYPDARWAVAYGAARGYVRARRRPPAGPDTGRRQAPRS